MKNRNMDRRLFLRGLGGAAIAAPFLSTLGVRSAIGQSAAAATGRVIIYFTHYGCITEKWFPTNAHGALTATDFEGTSIAALAPFAAKALIPRGLRGMNEWTFEREFGQETDPHSQVMASYLTSAPVDRTSSGQTLGGGINFDKLGAIPYGRSLDHAIADQLNPAGVGPMVAHFDGVKTDSPSTLSYSAALEPYRGVGSPDQMFATLTNLGAAPSGELMNEDTYRLVVRGENAPDLVRERLTWLTNQSMSQADKDKLNHWIELTNQASVQVRSALCTEDAAAAAGLSLEGGGGFPGSIPVMMDLAVMNAMCNQNAIQLLMMPGNKSNYIDGVSGENHGLSHRIGNANMGGTCVNGVLDMLETIDKWYAGHFAYLAERMDSIQETEGSTLLDNSATIWLMEQSDGQAHNLNNMPVLQLGGLGGYMKVGQAVNLEDGSPTMSNGNSLTQCGSGDGDIGFNEVQGTGTDNAVANVPMLKYFYTLMNGLGVKANADGFPEVGGTNKVSKYGWTDDQQQFAEFVPNSGQGIADKPQGTFIDPGELEDLLA
jgi:hypothetical protein